MGETRNDTVRVFNGREIRVAWNEEEQKEFYSIADVCGALTGSENPRKYWSKLRQRLAAKDGQTETICSQLETKCRQLKLLSDDGKRYLTDVADTETILELIKYIKSKETDTFRSWLSGTVEGQADNSATAVAVRKYDPVFDTDYETHIETILAFAEEGRARAYRSANRELIRMCWRTGEYVSAEAKEENWGRGVVQELSARLQRKAPEMKGFSASNIWRMKQFYETYRDNKILAALSREISWWCNVLIISRAKSDEEREFYLRLSKEHNYSVRDLERQIKSSLFERKAISDIENEKLIKANPSLSSLHDPFIAEFLGLPEKPTEREMKRAITENIHKFILELGNDFSFVNEEHRIRVDDRDFYIDLVFYNHRLSCYLAVELKTAEFHPDHLGRMTFYLEALDRELKGPHDNPSIGLIICAGKRDMVVEYAIGDNIPKTLVAKYERYLPKKELLEKRLRGMRELRGPEEYEDAL